MYDQSRHNRTDHQHRGETAVPPKDDDTKLRIVAGFALGVTALVVLALTGGTLNVTSTGVTMNVNRPQL